MPVPVPGRGPAPYVVSMDTVGGCQESGGTAAMLRRQRWRKDPRAPRFRATPPPLGGGARGAGEPISEAEGEERCESEWSYKGRGPIGTWGGCAAIEPQGEGEFEQDHAPFARLRLLGARDEREPGAVRWGRTRGRPGPPDRGEACGEIGAERGINHPMRRRGDVGSGFGTGTP